jgi:parallel beta-helix repeat protein
MDYATIQQAVTAANPHDTIRVDPGTYAEQVTVNKTLTLEGAQHGVDARGRSGPESIVTGVGNGGKTPFYVTANDVTLDGFTVQGATNANQFGFGILLGAGQHGAHVLNNIVQDNIAGLSLANNSTTDQAVIQHNLFKDNNQPGAAQGTGIYTDQFNAGGTLSDVLIDGNTFSGQQDGFGTGSGIGFSSTDATKPATGITISNNVFNGNDRGLYAFSLTASTITDNTFENATGSQTADIRIFEGVNGLTIKCNTLENGAGRAIRVSNAGTGLPNATNITVTLNSISGYPVAGLEVNSGSYTGTLNAQNNWWGAASGPTNPSNPGGTGEKIIAPDNNVNFTPWLITPPGTSTTLFWKDAAGDTLTVDTATGNYTLFLASGGTISGSGARVQNGELKIHDHGSGGEKIDATGPVNG